MIDFLAKPGEGDLPTECARPPPTAAVDGFVRCGISSDRAHMHGIF
jgi:hypothetical protein